MKNQVLLAALASGLMVGGAQGAILQSHAGGTHAGAATPGGSSTSIIDTTNDTGDWLDTWGDSTHVGTLYYGFDYTVTDTTGTFGGLRFYNGTSGGFGAGTNFANANHGVYGTSFPFPHTGTPYVVGTTNRIVIRFDLTASTFESSGQMWVDPTSEGDASLSAGSSTFIRFDSIRLDGNMDQDFSNVVFATTFAEASGVPEPGSLALLGLGGMALLRRRRRA